MRSPAAAASVCGSASSGVRIAGRAGRRSRPLRRAPRRRPGRGGWRRAAPGRSGKAGSGDEPDQPEQVGEQQRRQRDQHPLGRPEGLADAPVVAVLAQPGVAGGQKRGQEQGDGEQRDAPAGDEVADPDVLVGTRVGGQRRDRASGSARAPSRPSRERLRGDRVGNVIRGRDAALAVGAQRDRLDPGPAQRHLLAEPDRGGAEEA